MAGEARREVIPFFRRRQSPLGDPRLTAMEDRHRELQEKLTRLEEMLGRMAEAPRTINIEQLHVHQPVLERLEYRLDRLDIEQLSGSLNLGNNFGAKVGELAGKPAPAGGSKEARPKPEEPSGAHAGAADGLSRTATGFRIRQP